MKVAITINTSWNIYNFRLGLVRALLAEGHQVIAIASLDSYSEKLQFEGCDFIPIEIQNTGTNPIREFKLYRQLKRIYNQHKPDVILHYTVKPNIYGSIAANTLGIPVINNVSGLGTVFLNEGLTSSIAKKLYSRAFKNVDLVFFQNRDDRETFLKYILIPNLKTDILPGSGINLDQFTYQKISTEKSKVFLMIARLLIDKGVNEYIRAAEIVKKKYPNVKFQLLGKIDEEHTRGVPKKTIDIAMQKNLIEYLGEVDDVKPFIQSSSCVVLPSYREGTPRTLLEAAAMGRPVVTTDVPGCREVVIDGISGFLCKVKDPNDLAEKISTIQELSTQELNNMGKEGRNLIERKFDEQIVINQYLNHVSYIKNQNSF